MNIFEIVITLILGLWLLLSGMALITDAEFTLKYFKILVTNILLSLITLVFWIYSVQYFKWYEPSFWN